MVQGREGAAAVVQVASDEECIALWLNGASPSTQIAYKRDVAKFRTAVPKPLKQIKVSDIQQYQDGLSGAINSRTRAMNALRSLFRFACDLRYVSFNPMCIIRRPKIRPVLKQKYLSPEQVHMMIDEEPSERNRLILQVLYYGGLRVSELCHLKFRDVILREDMGNVQLSVLGKGSVLRQVPLPRFLSEELMAFRGEVAEDAPVFPSQIGQGHLDSSRVFRIVKKAAKRVGIAEKPSPHWLRHASATHSLANGAPLHVVQQTLGHSSLSVTGLYLHARPNESSGMYLKKGG